MPSLEALIDSRHSVVAVVSQPDRPKGRGQQLQPTPTKAVARRARHPRPAAGEDPRRGVPPSTSRRSTPDLGVVVAYGRILPDALLAIPRLGMINVHASMLPRYRGAAPVQRAVHGRRRGDRRDDHARGHRAGRRADVRRWPTVPIPPDATSGEVERDLAALGARAARSTWSTTSRTAAPSRRRRTRRRRHARRRRSTKDGRRRSTGPSRRARDSQLVRGLQPWPLAVDASRRHRARHPPHRSRSRTTGRPSAGRHDRRARTATSWSSRPATGRSCGSSRSSPKGDGR